MGKSMSGSAIPITIAREERAGGVAILYLEGFLGSPLRPELRRQVESLLRCGERRILLDLAEVTAIDAAGVGLLVQLYCLADAADAELWIENASKRTRTFLELIGLFELLSPDPLFEYEKCS
jgi:anti-anti-sigma factor